MHLNKKLNCPKCQSNEVKRDWGLGHDIYVDYFYYYTYTCLKCNFTKEYDSMSIDEDPPEPTEWLTN